MLLGKLWRSETMGEGGAEWAVEGRQLAERRERWRKLAATR